MHHEKHTIKNALIVFWILSPTLINMLVSLQFHHSIKEMTLISTMSTIKKYLQNMRVIGTKYCCFLVLTFHVINNKKTIYLCSPVNHCAFFLLLLPPLLFPLSYFSLSHGSFAFFYLLPSLDDRFVVL